MFVYSQPLPSLRGPLHPQGLEELEGRQRSPSPAMPLCPSDPSLLSPSLSQPWDP